MFQYVKKIMIAVTFLSMLQVDGGTFLATLPDLERQMDDLKNSPRAGTYPITIYDEEEKNEKTIYVTILFPKTVESKELGEAIDAYDVHIPGKAFAKLTDKELIKLTKARAWSTLDATPLKVSVDKKVEKDKKMHLYEVTFTTARGTKTTSNIILKEDMVSSAIIEEEYIHFFGINEIYQVILFAFILFIIPVVLLVGIAWLTKRRIHKIEAFLYRE